jgi:phage shock protein A
MSDQPEGLTLVFLRRLDTKMDGLREDMADIRHRFTTLEIQVANLTSLEGSHYASLSTRLDRTETRLERIETRLDLVSA